MIARTSLIALLALPLAGCFEATRGTIAGGECKVFERPPYVVLGKRQYDQDWIDSQVEGGVGGCGWKRPAARPAELDAKPAPKKAAPPVKKKIGVIRRVKDRIWPSAAAPVLPTPEPPAVVAPPAPKSRDPIDELLQPDMR